MEDVEKIEDQSETNYSRRSRISDKRGTNCREATRRAPITFGNISQFNVVDSVLADRRYQFGWVPYIVNNQQVEIPYDNAVRDGWQCVESSEYHGLQRVYKHDPFNRRQDEDQLIRKGGQIFMKREVELKEAEEKYYDEERAHRDRLIKMHIKDSPSSVHIMSQHRSVEDRPRY